MVKLSELADCDGLGLADLVTVATTTTREFGFNANTEAVLHGSTRNPWRPVPGRTNAHRSMCPPSERYPCTTE
jgi:Asp-tRNA(Asn)/Glu-tRNA(Gln) amidotransferase A subunit family amidase